jgi:hypothetical protein
MASGYVKLPEGKRFPLKKWIDQWQLNKSPAQRIQSRRLKMRQEVSFLIASAPQIDVLFQKNMRAVETL